MKIFFKILIESLAAFIIAFIAGTCLMYINVKYEIVIASVCFIYFAVIFYCEGQRPAMEDANLDRQFERIQTLIESCNNAMQEQSMINMIENFRNRWKNTEMVNKLYTKLHEKFDKYHTDID